MLGKLSGGDVEASLLMLVLYVASAHLALVFQYLGQDGLQDDTVGHFLLGQVGVLHTDKLVAGDVERSAILVAAVLRGVHIDVAQLLDIFLCAQHRGHHEFVEGITF